MGNNSHGQLGLNNKDDQIKPVNITKELINTKILQISCGAYHSLILTDDGGLYSMGCNEKGQLGNGTVLDSTAPLNITS